MNYVEIIARQEELQKEMQDLQEQRVESAQSHTTIVTDQTVGDIDVTLTLNYDLNSHDVLELSHKDGTSSIFLTIEDFNQIGLFLQKYNDAIFSYMSELNQTDEDDSDTE